MLLNSRAMLTGVGIGAGLMYFMDPTRGRRRRALVRDKIAHSASSSRDGAGALGRDIAHRAAGAVARVRGALRPGPVDDGVLVERVRAKLGRLVSHPHAIRVDATDGCVRLRGPVLHAEVTRLMRAVGRVRGVCGVVNELDEYHRSGHVPSLQGGRG